MSMSKDELDGTLQGIEYMLGQLYGLALANVERPQAWINENTVSAVSQIVKSERASEAQKLAASEMIRRVMQGVSWYFEEQGRGAALHLVTAARPD